MDEARDDALYELGIAFNELPPDETPKPWVGTTVLRYLLVDLTISVVELFTYFITMVRHDNAEPK